MQNRQNDPNQNTAKRWLEYIVAYFLWIWDTQYIVVHRLEQTNRTYRGRVNIQTISVNVWRLRFIAGICNWGQARTWHIKGFWGGWYFHLSGGYHRFKRRGIGEKNPAYPDSWGLGAWSRYPYRISGIDMPDINSRNEVNLIIVLPNPFTIYTFD